MSIFCDICFYQFDRKQKIEELKKHPSHLLWICKFLPQCKIGIGTIDPEKRYHIDEPDIRNLDVSGRYIKVWHQDIRVGKLLFGWHFHNPKKPGEYSCHAIGYIDNKILNDTNTIDAMAEVTQCSLGSTRETAFVREISITTRGSRPGSVANFV